MELTDRNVVITGAGSGIGAALARRFAAERPRALVLADLNADNVKQVAEEVGGVAVQTDVGQEAEINELLARAREAGGPVDVFLLQRRDPRARRRPAGDFRGGMGTWPGGST